MSDQYYAVIRTDPNKKKDELQHWKYIKKYKKNGKWRYVYNVGSTGEKIDGQIASPYREYSKLQDILGYDERDAAAIANTNYKRKYENAVAYNHNQNPTYYKQSTSDAKFRQASVAGKKASLAMKRYYKTPLGRLDQVDDVIDRGRTAVSKLLSKMSKAVSPKKETNLKTTNYSYSSVSRSAIKKK